MGLTMGRMFVTPRRRADDNDDEGMLSRRAQPIARFIKWAWAIGAAVAAAAVGTYTLDRSLASAAARDVVEARVAPLERRVDDHLSNARAMREVMDRYVQEQRALNRSISRKLDALCRSNPKADCPLGDD